MAEYRLEDLARVSGVSARNIRAYRERGLLDPPRRVGRSALYDDYHLSQLNTISQLLRRGYNSAHIAEFFESMRHGADLADILGLQRAVLGSRTDSQDGKAHRDVDLDVDSEEARALVAHGLARIDGRSVVMTHRVVGDILSRSPQPMLYIRALLRFLRSVDGHLDGLAVAFVETMSDLYYDRGGAELLPKPSDPEELRRLLQDYRTLGAATIATRFEEASRRHMVNDASEAIGEILLTGAGQPERA
ncbi:MerR family transcriptional regulator [Mycobacterium sp. SMC-4]|uniref:MerR family transcriptional regulator n=1 Tax=Mycobacterium sp. SMC-4 TaxID=2857059 RepID=UPI0021B28D07|nr:MerR family transcriptional regulator [Mycobacterium sp. SMC-4]UXA16532.1 MerR family transcriptional regulator [Mycobacterium sp. SMC-4]